MREEVEAKVEGFLEELLSESVFEGSSLPHYVISGSGDAWFLDTELKQMVMISRGTEIVPIPGDEDPREVDSGVRTLVRAPYRFLLVPEDEIQEIGWN